MLLLKQRKNKDEWVNKKVIKFDFKAGNSKKYEINTIKNSIVYLK